MKPVDLETEKGTGIIESLKQRGWKQVNEYSCLAFDKGIDYDSYTLKKGGAELVFEWTNWFEWQVSGSAQAIKELAEEYSLTIQEDISR